MNADICTHDHLHRLGDSATHPSEPRYGALAGLQAVLLLLAGMSPQRRRASQALNLRQRRVQYQQVAHALNQATDTHRVGHQAQQVRPIGAPT